MTSPNLDRSDLTHSQLQIWLGQTLHADAPLYNMAFGFVFAGGLDPARFCRAWQHVVDGNEALRTSVVSRDGVPVRQVAGPGALPTIVERLDLDDPDQAVASFRVWCRERARRVFRLDGPLVESVLVPLDADRVGWFLNQHHLVTDAASTVQLYRQLAEAYGSDGPPPAAPPYYATARERPLSPAARTAAETHWARRAAAATGAWRLYGRPATPRGTASTRLTLDWDETRRAAVQRVIGEPGFASLSSDLSRFALFATLLVGWLHRVSGRSHLGLDAPVAGRTTPDARRALGLFMEVFPFDVVVEADDTFRDLGRRCLAEARQLLEHAQPGTSRPSGAARGVVLNFLPEPFGPFGDLRTDVEWVHPGHGDAAHAVRLQVHDFGGRGGYTVHLDVNDAVLDADQRTRAVEHFDAVARAALEDPDQPVGRVDLRTADERDTLDRLNATVPSPGRSGTVVDRIAAQTAARPEQIALRDRVGERSRQGLWEEAGALAATLRAHGVAPGDRVALLGRRGIPLVVAVLAVLRVRAVFVPLHLGAPPERTRLLLEDAGAVLLLHTEDVALHDEIALPALDILEGVEAGRGDVAPDASPALDDLAYLIYTSGSTGRPKGVLIEHRGLVHYLDWAASRYVRGGSLTWAWFTPLAFDLTLTSLLLPLVTDGVLEIYPEPEGPVDAALVDVVRANAVDVVKLTPSHLSILARLDLTGSRLRCLIVGGEDLKTGLARIVADRLGEGVEIYNEYGPTEAVVGCVCHRYAPDDDRATSVPIGAPIDGVQVRVLDGRGVPVPDGVPGELWVASPALARGYHEQPALTDARFRPDPTGSGLRCYRTGDLVRVVAPGRLEYLGRVDRQVKVSGFRVEPAEIEAVTGTIAGVAQCVVAARRRPASLPVRETTPTRCVRCGLSSEYPGATVGADGVCSICRTYASIRDRAADYFRTLDDLRALFDASAAVHDPPYDALMLLSGGKDSTYALCRLVEMGLRVHAFTLDNGYISDGATANMRRVTAELGVPLEVARTAAMPAIFRDSLERFSNVCQGCFKTIYTLALTFAHARGIPVVVTGLSRGQLFETRLTEDLFASGRYAADDVDRAVLEARKAYHRADDAVARGLDVSLFQTDDVFDRIRVIDFYRYCDVGLDEMLAYLGRRVPWVRPEDTGRSTNCLINDAGIFVHRRERGFHNYALPYSWDVRLGQKRRDAAIEELDDTIDERRVRGILAEIGYDPDRVTPRREDVSLGVFYVAPPDVTPEVVRAVLARQLPPALVPAAVVRVDALPLTPNGKVDEAALPWPDTAAAERAHPARAPDGPVEAYLVELWREQLGRERVAARGRLLRPRRHVAAGHGRDAPPVPRVRHHVAAPGPLPALTRLDRLARVDRGPDPGGRGRRGRRPPGRSDVGSLAGARAPTRPAGVRDRATRARSISPNSWKVDTRVLVCV